MRDWHCESGRAYLKLDQSFFSLSVLILPTGLGYTGNESVQGGFAESQTRTAELAQITMTASAHRAAVYNANGAGVLRQFGEGGIIALGFQFSAQCCVLFDGRCFAIVSFNP